MTMISVARVEAALATRPRIQLATLPTPLQEASGLREALGGANACPRILIKRDDLTSLGGGCRLRGEVVVGLLAHRRPR